jgi:hypothetical protein
VSFSNADAEGMPLGMAALDDGLGAAFARCVFDRTQKLLFAARLSFADLRG